MKNFSLYTMFIGLFSLNCMAGSSPKENNIETIHYDNGAKFKGYCIDGSPSYGKLFYTNGAAYKGKFLNGMPNGRGILTLADGSVIKGEFKNGKIIKTSYRSKDHSLKATKLSKDDSKKGELITKKGKSYDMSEHNRSEALRYRSKDGRKSGSTFQKSSSHRYQSKDKNENIVAFSSQSITRFTE